MSYHQLTENERYQIDAFIKAGFTQKRIAEQLGRSPSTISRDRLLENDVITELSEEVVHLARQQKLVAAPIDTKVTPSVRRPESK